MAPNGDTVVAAAVSVPAPAPAPAQMERPKQKPRRISMEGLQRAMSDLALELTKESKRLAGDAAARLPAVTEQVDEARCECCGMMEECTAEYVRRVRERYCGRWVCGLCSAAVKDEADRNHGGRTTEAALAAHMGVCGQFNSVGRANPVLMQTEAMREILRKRCGRPNGNSNAANGGGLTRSSSCISAITKDLNLNRIKK